MTQDGPRRGCTRVEGLDQPPAYTGDQPMSTLALPASTLEHLSPDDLALAGFLARYKGKTRTGYAGHLRVYVGWCMTNGLRPLDAKRPHLELYVRWLEQQGWSESTVSGRVITVCQFYKYATIDDLIAKDPTVHLDRPKVDLAKQKRTYLPALSMARWMIAAEEESPTAAALGAILGTMGLRIAEACSLNIEDIHRVKGWDCISFVGKGNKAATVPIPVPVLRYLEPILADRTEGPILTTRRGTRMDRSAARRLIKKVAETALIDTDISPHSFRRTMVTTLLQQGVPLYEVQKAARHANPKTTMVYDQAATSLDKNATHIAAAFYASLTAA